MTIGGRMKRLILTITVVLFSTLSLWAQAGASAPDLTTPNQTEAHSHHHRNKQHNHRHQPRHRTGINARR